MKTWCVDIKYRSHSGITRQGCVYVNATDEGGAVLSAQIYLSTEEGIRDNRMQVEGIGEYQGYIIREVPWFMHRNTPVAWVWDPERKRGGKRRGRKDGKRSGWVRVNKGTRFERKVLD